MFKKNVIRKFVILFFVCTLSTQLQSQVLIALLFGDKLNSGNLEFGLTGGLNMSNLTSLENAQMKAGLNLALFFNIKLSDKWYIHPEAAPKYATGVKSLPPYSLGDESLDNLLKDGTVTRKINTIAVPLMMRYRIKGEFFAEAGPQIGLRTKAKDIFENGDLSYEKNIQDQLTRFDAGFAFGLAQRFKKGPGAMALSLRYYAGFTDTDKFTPGSQKHSVFQILASIPVGGGKKKEAENK